MERIAAECLLYRAGDGDVYLALHARNHLVALRAVRLRDGTAGRAARALARKEFKQPVQEKPERRGQDEEKYDAGYFPPSFSACRKASTSWLSSVFSFWSGTFFMSLSYSESAAL